LQNWGENIPIKTGKIMNPDLPGRDDPEVREGLILADGPKKRGF
jgi:hypothetical protein